VLEQDTLAAFISQGHMARHVRRMRRIYGARRELLLARLRSDFAGMLDPIPSIAGLHVAAFATPQLDMERIAERARAIDVGVYPLRPYYASRRARQGLVFGYGAIEGRDIAEGLARLRRVFPA
jgi:GntR family transcriptional regulator/MocR family aminotransferase